MTIRAWSKRLQVHAKSDEPLNEAVYQRILEALHCGKLQPGQRLPEPAIARALGVSRERVRLALHRLSYENWLELVPNKGTCVPEIDEHTLESSLAARRLVEVAVVYQLAKEPLDPMLAALESHLDAEIAAAHDCDRRRQIPLSFEFHKLLFAQLDNVWLSDFLQKVAMPTVMAYAFFAPSPLPHCGGPNEHRAIVQAIKSRDPEAAARLMEKHLDDGVIYARQLRGQSVRTSIEKVLESMGPFNPAAQDKA